MAHVPSIAKTVPFNKVAKPLLSISAIEARRRVMNLYRLWYREVPNSIELHGMDLTIPQLRSKLRGIFEKNRHIEDIRVIDMMVVKGTMELEETANGWKQLTHVMRPFEIPEPKKKDFLTSFYEGYD